MHALYSKKCCSILSIVSIYVSIFNQYLLVIELQGKKRVRVLLLGYEKVKSFSLLLFAVLCTWFRIINYPIIAYQSNKYAPNVRFQQKFFKFDCIFLWLLYFCHLCWFYDILKAVKEIIQGKPDAIRDNRSE